MSSRWTRRSCTRRTPPDAEMLFNTTRHALRTFLAYGTVFGFPSTEAICLSPRTRVRVRLARRCRSILGSRSYRIRLSLPRACEALTPIVNGSSHALFAPPPTPPLIGVVLARLAFPHRTRLPLSSYLAHSPMMG